MTFTPRDTVTPSDRDLVRKIVESTGFFTPEEELIAVELVDEHLAKGPSSGYFFLFCEDGSGSVLGYTCFGPIPGTKESFDLYWIAVDKERQGLGAGRWLMQRTEEAVMALGGTRIYADTSLKDLYEPTRTFYLHLGYHEEARFEDFYAPGDGKVIYVKVLA